MKWLNRNGLWIAGGLIALSLAGAYLFQNIREDRRITEALNAATQKLESLARRDPYPNQPNIAAAKHELQKLRDFLREVEVHFAPSACPQQIDNMGFRTYLESTRAGLVADAVAKGVEIPTNYWFTFAAQKGAMTFSHSALKPLASQLADIGILCGAVFDAHANALAWLKRVPVDSRDSLSAQDYLDAKPTTNNWTITMPYEVTFQGFTSELADFFEKLTSLPQCFVVHNLVVEPVGGGSAAADLVPAPMFGGAMDRYKLHSPVRRFWSQDGPQNFLDEKLLRFTLSVRAVKLKPNH